MRQKKGGLQTPNRMGNIIMKISKNDEKWMANYEALKAYIDEHHHLPDKHKVENCGLMNFSKYTRKKIKEGTLDEEKRVMFEELLATRSNEYTGGRKKRVDN